MPDALEFANLMNGTHLKNISLQLSILAAVLAVQSGAPASAQSTLADPFKDSRYMSGYREVAPSAVPEELRDADALTRIKATRRISACGDPYAFPSTEITDEARGYDVELLRRIAADAGWETQFVWVNTSNRGGLNRAFRTTIKKGVCDVFLGLGTGGMNEALQKSRLTLIEPTFGVRYVLVTFDQKLKDRSLAELAKAGTPMGATYFSPTEKLLDAEGLKHESFPEARRALQAMAAGKIAAALIPSTSLAEAKREFPERTVYVIENFEPRDAFNWNNAWAVQEKETQLRAFLEERLAALAASGELQALLERYGIPYFPPFTTAAAESPSPK
jgi:ABC-type amino acid transport substrate-binding protein